MVDQCWIVDDYYDFDLEVVGKFYIKVNGLVDDVDMFDVDFFGVVLVEVMLMEL